MLWFNRIVIALLILVTIFIYISVYVSNTLQESIDHPNYTIHRFVHRLFNERN